MITSTARPAVDSPSSLRHIPHRFRNDDADRSALELIEALDGDWKTAAGPVELLRFTDGITNTLLKATKRRPGRSEAEVDEEAVLIRAYGEGTAVLIDRERELRAHSRLATLGFAPPLLATFDNGIMYRFIRGSVCTPEAVRAIAVSFSIAQPASTSVPWRRTRFSTAHMLTVRSRRTSADQKYTVLSPNG
ncbi:hypothetical protein LTR54_015715 [Friedmanniomyces endolithicus]|nr:hypothetical protein LTR54_015715 [Friedmanniomyces endolithicus]